MRRAALAAYPAPRGAARGDDELGHTAAISSMGDHGLSETDPPNVR